MFDILRGKVAESKKETRPVDKKDDKRNISKLSYIGFPNINTKKETESLASDPLNFPKNILSPEVRKDNPPQGQSIVSDKLISALKQHGVDNQEKARQTYEDAVEIIKVFLLKVRAKEGLSGYMDKLYELLDNVFKQLVIGDNLLKSVYEEKGEEDYLPHHIVNVLILAYVLGLNSGFNKSRLSHLGLASIFCDLGLDSIAELVRQPKTLTNQERETVKAHVAESLEVVNSIGALNEIVKETIAMHHERAGGNGYPHGLGLDDINPYAKIIGLVDVYEAITHSRSYRERMSAHQAVRALIGPLRNDFDTDVIKVFINKMSVYPIGSTVKLDTGETARVTGVRPGSPLKPVVMIFRGPNGESVSEMNIIDLSKRDSPSIKE